MKNLLTILLFAVCISSFATIRRVNNNVGVIAVNGLVYTTLDAAISDAIAEDTIYVEPSSNVYGITSLSKKLHFFGNGYRIGENQTLINPLPYDVKNSQINGTFTINSGGQGSTFRGLVFDSGTITASANNLLFSRCTFKGNSSLSLSSANNIFEQCFGFQQSSISQSGIGNIFRNCIWAGIISSQNNGLFDQCYIRSISSITNCVFTNCIVRTYSSIGSTNSFSFCIKLIDGSTTTFPSPGINNNIENINVSNVFVENPPIDNFDTFDKSFRYTANSQALNNGSSGQHIGPFGGASPYRLSGQPPIPVISNFFLSTTGSTASGLSGSITIQSNN